MVVNLVLQLSDGEELVVEGLEEKSLFEDPRERTIAVRRAIQGLALEEECPSGLTPLDQDRARANAGAPHPEEEATDLDETPPLGFWPQEKAK